MTDTPCRVSADLRAQQRREDAAPDEICDQCEAELFGDADAENWLVCLRCGNALCEDCCIGIRTAEQGTGLQLWLGWETIHNEGYCSAYCMWRELDDARREIGRLVMEARR